MKSRLLSYYLFFKINDCRQKVDLFDIILLQADSKYIRVITTNKTYLIRGSLTDAERGLHPEFFCRVHRSYIISLFHIDKIHRDHIVLGNHIVPLHTDYTQSFLQRLPSLN